MVGRELVHAFPRQRRAERLDRGIGRPRVDADPVSGGDLPRACLDRFLDDLDELVRVFDADPEFEHLGDAADHPREVERVLVQVIVRVDQARDDRVALGVDHLGPVGYQRPDLGVAADRENPVAPDRERLGDSNLLRVVVVCGDDLAVDDDRLGIWRCASVHDRAHRDSRLHQQKSSAERAKSVFLHGFSSSIGQALRGRQPRWPSLQDYACRFISYVNIEPVT